MIREHERVRLWTQWDFLVSVRAEFLASDMRSKLADVGVDNGGA